MKHFTLALVAAATLCAPTFAQNRVKNLYTTSDQLQIEQLQVAEQPVQINRILFAGYNTLCVPMTLDADQLQKAARDVQVERLGTIRQEGNTLYMYFVDCTDEGVQAGMPYLIYSPTIQNMRIRSSESNAISTQLKSVSMNDGQGNHITFGSSWQSITGDGRYGIPAKQETDILQAILQRTDGTKTFLPTRCGFTWDAQSATAQNLEIKHVTSLEGLVSGIGALQANDAVVDVFDAKGTLVRKNVRAREAMQSLPRGIYVIGGEKIAVK